MEVLYEDNHVIAVSKPAGLLIQGDKSGDVCLLDLVRDYLRVKYSKPGQVFVGLVHRLDKPVAGVVLFAKTSKGASRLSAQIRDHSFRKTYRAVVQGSPPETAILVHYLSDDGPGERVRVFNSPGPGLKRAELSYRVLRRLEKGTVIEIDLKTGRKHQIRAQLAHIGHPILGDSRYGASEPYEAGAIALVAHSVEFFHPVRPTERVRVDLPRSVGAPQ